MAIPAYSTDIDNTPAQQVKFSVGIVKGPNIPAFTNERSLIEKKIEKNFHYEI